MMAEGGSIDALSAEVTAFGGQKVENPNSGLLMPGVTTPEFTLDTLTDTHLSLTAMLLPTNDAFGGLDGWEIPTTAGTYTLFLNAL